MYNYVDPAEIINKQMTRIANIIINNNLLPGIIKALKEESKETEIQSNDYKKNRKENNNGHICN